jgi:hypothetical protein
MSVSAQAAMTISQHFLPRFTFVRMTRPKGRRAELRTCLMATAKGGLRRFLKSVTRSDHPNECWRLPGRVLRHDPLEGRKATLEMIMAKAGPGIRFNGYIEGDGETVFRHACKLGLEGIVSTSKPVSLVVSKCFSG